MKTILTILLLSITVSVFGNTRPDSLVVNRTVYVPPTMSERQSNGIVLLISGLLLSGVGFIAEHTRTPHVPHATTIDYNPNAAKNLNYTVMGIGLGTAVIGTTFVIKF